MASQLKKSLPWTTSPLIVNAPMAGFAGPDLAAAVTKAGGLGQVGFINDVKQLEQQLVQLSESLPSSNSTLPIGVGMLPFILKIDSVLPLLSKFNPAVLWMFAAKDLDDYTTWAARLRQACPRSQIWIQVGSVGAAIQIAKTAKPDVLVIQGIDAGGHGFEKGAGIISLLPEVVDAFKRKAIDIPLVASGGIVDGRGVAAALSLGASGVVMGTRFLGAKETTVHPKYQAAVIEARDGGQCTVRDKMFDELKGPNPWPMEYDGRSLVTNSYRDHAQGMATADIQHKHAEAVKDKDMGWGDANYAVVWAGTGVGLVKSVQPAGEIVEEVRKGAMEALDAARARL